MVWHFKVYLKRASQAISQINVICVFQKYIPFHQNYSFHSFCFNFQFLHQRWAVKLWAPWDCFPICDITSQSSLSLQNAWRAAEEKRKHRHHPYLLLPVLGQACSPQPGFCCYTQFEPKEIPMHSSSRDSHLFKQVGTRISVLPKGLLQLNQQLEVSIKNVQGDKRNTEALSGV